MRQAIVTRYHGPTDRHGARISAKSQAGQKFYPREYALDADDDFTRCAEIYARSLDWLRPGEKLVGGGLPDGNSAAFIIVRK